MNIVIDVLRRFGIALLLVLIQALILNRIHLFGCITALVYVYTIVSIPNDMPRWQSLTMAFIIGLLVDMFSNTPGLAAASLTFLALAQSYLVHLFMDSENRDATHPSPRNMGWLKYCAYVMLLILIYCLVFFMLEVFHFDSILLWCISVFGSWFITSLMVFAISLASSR